MYEQTLNKAGLTTDQASIYEVLLKNGPLPAGEVSKKAGLKRGLTYKVLDELAALGLVAKNSKLKVLRFEAAHPLRLKELAEQKEQSARVAQEALGGIISNLTSDFNLISGKPGVQYREGKGVFEWVTEDSLQAKGEIYSFIDNVAVTEQFAEANKRYVKKRIALGIKKKMITGDSEYIRLRAQEFHPELSEVRVIPKGIKFATVMQMYNNRISYLTIDGSKTIGVIIDDAHIAQMHRAVFEYIWSVAESIRLPDQAAA